MGFMTPFVAFLEQLLTEGTVLLRTQPCLETDTLPQAERLLAAAYEDHRLDVAGPPIPFDAAAAIAAATQLWFACWFLLHRGDPLNTMEKCLPTLSPPVSAAQHLSTDLVLRFAPQVQRRARTMEPSDVLTHRLEELLRRHPLSGVLSDIEEGPQTPIRLDDHPGLQLLYAERLVERVRPAWVPDGPAYAYVEMIFAERGLPVPEAMPPKAQTTELRREIDCDC
jgi:hypothetical protein